MRGTGAEQLVVAWMRPKGRGAKGLRHSNRLASQPGRGGTREYGKGLRDSEGAGVGSLRGRET